MHKVDLKEGWLVSFEDLHWGPEQHLYVLARKDGWMPAELPCDIHVPLIEQGIIKEPIVANQSFDCEWTEQKSWWFVKTFAAGPELLEREVIELTFESLDAEADVFLNGIHLGHHRSAFHPFIRSVKKQLREGENKLLVRLTSGLEHYSEADIADMKETHALTNFNNRGDYRRSHVRKPQYVYGGDWSPRIATCGIVKGASLTVQAGITKHYKDAPELELDEYLLYGGLCQGMMLGYSLEAIRYKTFCSGALFWMYNDCWGEVGWTIIDYYLKRKISFYTVKRAFEPVKLIIRECEGTARVIGINETPDPFELTIEYGYAGFDGSSRETKRQQVTLEPFSRESALIFPTNGGDRTTGMYFAKAEELNTSAAYLRGVLFREQSVLQAELRVSELTIAEGSATFTISSPVYAHAVHFNLDDRLALSDEYFDLLPGESREITVYGVPDGFAAVKLNAVSVTNC